MYIGFSFLAWKPTSNDRIYIYAAKSLAPFKFFCDSRKECLAKFDQIGRMKTAELLKQTFISVDDDNPFAESGFVPLKLVSTYIWISK